MIGNDVVDLKLSRFESNWQRKGFFDKIFTYREQILIEKSKNKEIIIWNLWSRKEAAYKIWNRQTGIRKINCIQFECQDINLECGLVKFEGKIYYTKTVVTKEFIHTIAVTQIKNFDNIEILNNSIEIFKSNGVPFYIDKNQHLIPISKSNHGQFEFIVTLNDF